MFLIFFRQQRPWDLLQGLTMSSCVVSRVNEMVIDFFYYSSISNFWIKFKLFKILENNCSKIMDLYEPVKLFQA